MMTSWSAWMMPSTFTRTRRPAALAQARDQRRTGTVERRASVPSDPTRREHLVPVVADPSRGSSDSCERLARPIGLASIAPNGSARGRAPVEQQPRRPGAVGESKPPDVHALSDGPRLTMRPRTRSKPKRRSARPASGRPVDSPCRGPSPAGRCRRPTLRSTSRRADSSAIDCSRQSPRWPRKCCSSTADRRRIGLDGEAVRKVKRAGSPRAHGISSTSVSTSPRDPCADSCTRTSRLPFFVGSGPGQLLCGTTRVCCKSPGAL